MSKKLKRRPKSYEEVKGVGPKRAERLRAELGPIEKFASNSKNFKRNRIASVVSGNRRNLPKFAENVLRATGSERDAVKAVDEELVEVENSGRSDRSKTLTRRRNEEADRSGLGFETMERDEVGLGAAFGAFTDEFDDEYDVPAAELGRSTPRDTDVTFQPLIGAATSRVTFAGGAQAEDFRGELERAAENTDRPTASPGELADEFVGFVEDRIGLETEVEGREVDRRDLRKARDAHEDRSAEARRVDGNRKAPVTTEFEQWVKAPSKLDFPGVDTP
jgi:hypothetical protein